MKYICDVCGRTMDEDELDAVYQWDGEGVMGGYHPVEDKCPHCGSTDLYEAQECCECGEYYAEDDMLELDNNWYCYECAKHIHDEFEEKWGKMRAC